MAERILPDWAKEDQTVWLDDDHAFTWTYAKGESEPNGGLHWHRWLDKPEPSATPGWCVGGITFGGNGWILESKDPITISPSLLCRSCGSHGFIRNGIWIKA